jgi:hypothetical protein
MSRLLKTLLGRAYSYEELLSESMPFLGNPRLPPGLPEVLSHFDGRQRTFVEFIQGAFKECLREIAAKETRQAQKAHLLSLCVRELSWNAVERAARNAEYVQSWEHYTKGSDWFERSPKDEWKRLLIARFLISLVCYSWLVVLARSVYQLESFIEPALDLYVDYDVEIKRLDVGITEEMLCRLANYDDAEGMKIGAFKDQVVRPIIDEQYAILDRLGQDIIAGKIDIEFYKAEFSRIDSIKQHVARTILATAQPE